MTTFQLKKQVILMDRLGPERFISNLMDGFILEGKSQQQAVEAAKKLLKAMQYLTSEKGVYIDDSK